MPVDVPRAQRRAWGEHDFRLWSRALLYHNPAPEREMGHSGAWIGRGGGIDPAAGVDSITDIKLGYSPAKIVMVIP